MKNKLINSQSKEVYTIAYPVVLAMISMTLINVVDTAMVGRIGASALAAVGLGGLITVVICNAFGSLEIGTQTLVARRYGEGNFKNCGVVLDNATIISICLGVVVTIVGFYSASVIINILSSDKEVIKYGEEYIKFRMLGIPFFILVFILRGFFNGLGKTKMQLQTYIIITIVNIFLNYVLIFGNWGFPKLGVKGAAIASTLSIMIGFLYFLKISFKKNIYLKYGYFKVNNFKKDIIKNLIVLSFPAGIRVFFVLTGFVVFLSIVGIVGTVELASSNIIVTIISVSFMPGIAFGVSASTLVGHALGENKPDKAEQYGWESFKLCGIFMVFLGLIFILFPEPILKIFTNDLNIIKTGKLSLQIVGAVQVFDAAGVVLSSAIQGAGMPLWVMLTEITIHWLFFLPLTYFLSITKKFGIVGAWFALAMYLTSFGLICSWKFHQGQWKKIIV